MNALWLALLLARPGAALDVDAPGAPAQRAREAVDALSAGTRAELRRMYLRYRDEVARRRDQDWEAGLLNEAVIENEAESFQPARLLEEAENNRRKELKNLQAELAKAGDDTERHDRLLPRLEEKQFELDRAKSKASRAKGVCRDWSDDVWSSLTAMSLDQWTVDDRRRSTRKFHSAAVVCAPQNSPAVCLAFDPWAEGTPTVYAFTAWDAQEAGGRIPADYFLHGLPEKAP